MPSISDKGGRDETQSDKNGKRSGAKSLLTAAILACKLGGIRVATPAPCPPTPGRLIADADDEGGRPGRDEDDDDGADVLEGGRVEVAIGGGDDTVDRGPCGLLAVDAGVGACFAGSTVLLLVVGDDDDESDAGDDPFMPPFASPAETAAAPKSFVLIPAAMHASGVVLLDAGREDDANAASSVVVVVALAPGSVSPALEAYSASSGTAGKGPGLLLVEGIPKELSMPSCNCSCCWSVRFASVGTIESLTAMGSWPTLGDRGVGGGLLTPFNTLVSSPSPDMLSFLDALEADDCSLCCEVAVARFALDICPVQRARRQTSCTAVARRSFPTLLRLTELLALSCTCCFCTRLGYKQPRVCNC